MLQWELAFPLCGNLRTRHHLKTRNCYSNTAIIWLDAQAFIEPLTEQSLHDKILAFCYWDLISLNWVLRQGSAFDMTSHYQSGMQKCLILTRMSQTPLEWCWFQIDWCKLARNLRGTVWRPWVHVQHPAGPWTRASLGIRETRDSEICGFLPPGSDCRLGASCGMPFDEALKRQCRPSSEGFLIITRNVHWSRHKLRYL